ncbi:MAG: hypothetical protein Q9224_000843 [Gallowayella concinna]
MRSACILSALVALAAAAPAPAPSPQSIDFAGVDRAPEPEFVSAPFDVATDQPLEKRELTLAFVNKDGSLSASKYMGLTTLKTFDPLDCAYLCDRAAGCQAFNLYMERDPTLDPNADDCPNPPSLTNYKCTLWGAPVVAEQATNKGQWRDSFEVAITGSNGYNKATPPPPIEGFVGPASLGGAINAPLDKGTDTYLGFKYFPFSQSQGYDPQTCADACNDQTGYNSRHPNADGTFATCSFFNAYALSQNGIPQGLYCSLYSKTWAPSYATNRGQYRGSDRFTPLDLTTALRPSLLPDETLLFVQDSVGLYEGKFKIPGFQTGHAYLTSHRACYVDNAEPRKNSVAINLKEVEKYDFYGGFLKSSAKVTLYPKSLQRPGFSRAVRTTTPTPVQTAYPSSLSISDSSTDRASSPLSNPRSPANTPRLNNLTWICPICSYSNPLPVNFDAASANAHTPLPSCLACGIKPPLAHILKAVIADASQRSNTNHSHGQPPLPSPWTTVTSSSSSIDNLAARDLASSPANCKFQCPRCTFQNHPSLLECELCGASLVSAEVSHSPAASTIPARSESPGPSLESHASVFDKDPEGIKFSFRAGGEKIFYERLKGAMTQRKWLLQNAPPIPKFDQPLSSPMLDGRPPQHASDSRSKVVGIAGLERRGLELRKNNETVIGNAFEDLEALMASAKEVVALAERFAHRGADKGLDGDALLVESATALGMVTTKNMLGSKAGSESLYLSELSRNVAEYLTDDAKGILRKEGGIMSLVDLWAVFNRTRGGVELVSPTDFEKAAKLWDKLSLPVRLRQFKNGLLVVQQHDWTDDKTVAQLLAWLQELHMVSPDGNDDWDVEAFGRGVTAQEAAMRFGWSIGVACEELAMAEEKGAVCREEGVEGIKYWENWFVLGQHDVTMGVKI